MRMNFEMPLIRIIKFGSEEVGTTATPVPVSAIHADAYGMQSFTTLRQVARDITTGTPTTKKILDYQY